MASSTCLQADTQDLVGFDVGMLSPISANSFGKDFDWSRDNFNLDHSQFITADSKTPCSKELFPIPNVIRRASQSSDQKAGLACMNCRPKKIKVSKVKNLICKANGDGDSVRGMVRVVNGA